MKLLNIVAVAALLLSSASFAVSVSTEKVENKIKVEESEILENNTEVTDEVDKLVKQEQGLPAEPEEMAAEESEPDFEIDEL